MNEIEVSSIDLVEGGNVFKQGHYLTLGYIPRDEKGVLVDLTGKTLDVKLWGRKGIGFEADAVYSQGVLRFTLNKTIPAGEYHVEFTVTSSTDATYRKKFPTNSNSGRIVIKQSADDLGVTGIQVYTVAQLKAEQKADQVLYEQTVDGKIVELEETVTAGIGAFTEDTEVINARQGKATLGENLNGITAQLAETSNYENFYKNVKSGKKIVMVGDSTTDQNSSPAIYTRFAEYVKAGGILEGATVVNRGSNGNELWRFLLNQAYNANTLSASIADQADLYIVSYGINDIRGGIDSAGRTKEQVRADLKTLVDRYLAETDGYILLRIPNTFVQDGTASTYFNDPNNAQLYSDQLYEIYESFRGYDRRVDVIDIPNRVFGKKVFTHHPLMKDALHPNENGLRLITDTIAEHISLTSKSKDVDDSTLLLTGTIASGTSSELIIGTASIEELKIGDVVLLGNSQSFIIKEKPKYLDGAWRVTHNNVNFSKYGVVRVVRKAKEMLLTTDGTFDSDWARGNYEGSNTPYLQFVFDLQTLGVLGSAKFDFDFEYYSESTNVRHLALAPWLNNNASPDTITGGAQVAETPSKLVTLGKINKLGFSFTADRTTNRYLHLLIVNRKTDSAKMIAEFGHFNMSINNMPVDMSGMIPHFYNAGTGSILERNITKRGILVTKRFMDSSALTSSMSKLTRDWNIGSANKATTGSVAIRVPVNISSYGFTTAQEFVIDFDFFSNDVRINNVNAAIWLNNISTDIGGGPSASIATPTVVPLNSYSHFTGKVTVDPNTYSYAHIYITWNASAGQKIAYEFGKLTLKIGGQSIDLSNAVPALRTAEAGSTLLKGAYRGDTQMVYRDFISELVRLGVLTV